MTTGAPIRVWRVWWDIAVRGTSSVDNQRIAEALEQNRRMMMCGPDITPRVQALPPEHELSSIMERELGVTIHPQALRMFIRANWRELVKHAHRIHDAK